MAGRGRRPSVEANGAGRGEIHGAPVLLGEIAVLTNHVDVNGDGGDEADCAIYGRDLMELKPTIKGPRYPLTIAT